MIYGVIVLIILGIYVFECICSFFYTIWKSFFTADIFSLLILCMHFLKCCHILEIILSFLKSSIGLEATLSVVP